MPEVFQFCIYPIDPPAGLCENKTFGIAADGNLICNQCFTEYSYIGGVWQIGPFMQSSEQEEVSDFCDALLDQMVEAVSKNRLDLVVYDIIKRKLLSVQEKLFRKLVKNVEGTGTSSSSRNSG